MIEKTIGYRKYQFLNEDYADRATKLYLRNEERYDNDMDCFERCMDDFGLHHVQLI